MTQSNIEHHYYKLILDSFNGKDIVNEKCKCGRPIVHHFNLDGSFKFSRRHEDLLKYTFFTKCPNGDCTLAWEHHGYFEDAYCRIKASERQDR